MTRDGALAPASTAETRSVPIWQRILDGPEVAFRFLKQHWQITCLTAIYFSLHLYVLSFTNVLMFDEHFWVAEARAILDRAPLEWTGYPHLSQLFIASGISVFGDSSWGWRMASICFGTIGVVLVYLIALELTGKRTAMLATVLYASENLVFTMSGLAMLDTIAVPFMLLSFLLYLKKKYPLAGISMALGTLCGPKVVLGILAIFGHWLLTRRKEGLRNITVFAVISLTSFLVLLPATDFLATGQWLNPFKRIPDMWANQTSVKLSNWTPEQFAISHPTRPWQWITEWTGAALEPRHLRKYLQITPTIWVLIVPSIAYLLYRYFHVKKNRNAPRFILLWFGATYVTWIPLELITDRPMFIYYFLPTVGAVCMAIGYAFYRAWNKSKETKRRNLGRLTQACLISYLLLHVLLFLTISPLPAGLGL